jgi:hypothetical protein
VLVLLPSSPPPPPPHAVNATHNAMAKALHHAARNARLVMSLILICVGSRTQL